MTAYRNAPAVAVITGNEAAATAAKLARVQVIAAYPITPQSPVVEQLSAVGRVRRAARRVRHRRVRALGADRLHRRLHGRRARLHRHVAPTASRT